MHYYPREDGREQPIRIPPIGTPSGSKVHPISDRAKIGISRHTHRLYRKSCTQRSEPPYIAERRTREVWHASALSLACTSISSAVCDLLFCFTFTRKSVFPFTNSQARAPLAGSHGELQPLKGCQRWLRLRVVTCEYRAVFLLQNLLGVAQRHLRSDQPLLCFVECCV